ncbi:MAG TPA: dihydrodipicolinate synthase family protein [Acidimicrobiia bacterium]
MRLPPRVMPALVTPFDGGGELDEAAHRRNLRKLDQQGIEGYLIGGSTGEGPYLEPGERYRLVSAARAELGSEAFLICGIAAETRRVALGQLAEAADAGADATLVMTPTTLIRDDHAAVAAHYQMLADVSPLPVMVYSVPPYTGYQPPVDMVAELSRHPGIVGMKDSGGDPVHIGRIAEATGDDFLLFSGSTAAMLLAITAGAYGAITSSCNYLSAQVLQIVITAMHSPLEARKPHRALASVVAVVEQYRIPGVKAAAAAAGLDPGECRLPLRPVPEHARAGIEAALASLAPSAVTMPAS